MNRSVIIQKMIQIGVLLEKEQLEYSGAEIYANNLIDEILSNKETLKEEVKKTVCKHDWHFCMSVKSPFGNKCSKCGEVR